MPVLASDREGAFPLAVPPLVVVALVFQVRIVRHKAFYDAINNIDEEKRDSYDK